MLTRRLLRIKAMQSIYAFKQNEESVYQLGIEYIKDKFYEYLLEIGKTEDRFVRKEEDSALRLYAQIRVGERQGVEDAATSNKVKDVVNAALVMFRSRRSHDNLTVGKKMIEEVELLYQRYLEVIQATLFIIQTVDFPFFQDHQIVDLLKQHPTVWDTYMKAGLDEAMLQRWVKFFKKDEALLKELEALPNDLEGHKDHVRTIIREFLFKHEEVLPAFEEHDINWTENQMILRGMVNALLKGLDDGFVAKNSDAIMSKNWEEDKAFFVQLYKLYFQKEAAYEAMIAEKTKKWAADRIATVDRILMIMAMCEMASFPSIPIKVTINEYIEISKIYSTPKSWQFINGMLDELTKSLMDSGEIKKSGRGLIDNK